MSDPNNPAPRWSVATMRRIVEQSPTLADAAQRYATLGVPVFPCAQGGKQPLTPNGFHDATANPRIVHAWWQRHPEANIGLPTGRAIGVVVVDVDLHAGGSGFAGFERARAEGLAGGWGWLVRTPSGGIHAYYPGQRNREQRSWQVPSAHVDFRGDGGYVIAPPSRIEVEGTTRTYEVIAVTTQPTTSVDATKLRSFLEPRRPAPAFPPPGFPANGCCPEALARTVAHTAEGGRNRTLFWASCRMVEDGLTRDDALAYLMPAAQHAGLGDREIETTVASAFRIASRLGPGSRPGPTRPIEGIRL